MTGGLLLDGAFAAVLLVRALLRYRKIANQLEGVAPELAGERRLALYRRHATRGWLFSLPPLALIALGRVSPAGLGLSITPLAMPMAVVLSGFFVFVFVVSRASIRRNGVSPRIAAAVEKDYLTPRSDAEQRWWWALSLQAGVVEELVYRGYLCWFFSRWMPLEWTLVPSSVMFGLGHLNQGVRRAIVTGVIGSWFGFLYVVTGSLVPAMAAHFTIDVVVGLLARLRREAALATAPARA